jgi:serine/threonine-protein kinase HipA
MKEILVYADWEWLDCPIKMGLLRAEHLRGEEIFSFEYNQDWLKLKQPNHLDPDLNHFSGPQYLSEGKSNFGAFLDSSPDRWGKMLMDRKAALQKKKTEQKPKRLSESDYLLGVFDETRMGALRFKTSENGPFLQENGSVKVPPFTSVRELEQASLHIEQDDFFEQDNARKWLRLLMPPGSSLGGARPKASVRHPDNSLWIAKFPSKNDGKNSGAWELIANELAASLGIDVSRASAKKYSHKQHTFLTRRFDRTNNNQRIHFASALTLLGVKDGYNYKEGASYLELVELIEEMGVNPEIDLKELWKRVVFSVAVSNTDDHLRNHGFLLTKNGWRLSPAYDINPNESGTGLSLNISENNNTLSYDLCMDVARYFRISSQEGKIFITKTKKAVSGWRRRAKDLKIPSSEMVIMEPAFRTE